MAHLGFWGAALVAFASCAKVISLGTGGILVSAHVVLPGQSKHEMPNVAALPAPQPVFQQAGAAQPVAIAAPSAAATDAPVSAPVRVAEAAAAGSPVTAPSAGAKPVEQAASEQPAEGAAGKTQEPVTAPASVATADQVMEPGDLSKAPRAAQIEPVMVEPVKRVAPKPASIKVKVETGSIDAAPEKSGRTAKSGKGDKKGSGAVKIVSDKPNCDRGYKLDAKGRSCIKVAASVLAKKKRR